MDWWLVSFFLGALSALLLPIVPNAFYLNISIIVTFTVTVLALKVIPLRAVGGFCLGGLVILIAGYQYNSALVVANSADNKPKGEFVVTEQLLLQPIDVVGKITTIPTAISTQPRLTQRFNFLVEQSQGRRLTRPLLIRLRWDQSASDGQQLIEAQQGQLWQFRVKLKPSYGLANIGGFHYQMWLRSKNIVATGYVKDTAKLVNPQSSLRQRLYRQVKQLISQGAGEQKSAFGQVSADFSPLLLALSFGERGDISERHWQVLKNTGTQHLIAISGLHLGLVASGSYLFALVIFRLLFSLLSFAGQLKYQCLDINYRLYAIVFSCLVAVFYAYLAGFSLPTVRALVMLLIFWLARLRAIYLTPSRIVLLTLVIVVVLEPMTLLSLSFWLSFSAVVIILLGFWRFQSTLAVRPQASASHEPLAKYPLAKYPLGKHKVVTWLSTLLFLQAVLFIFMMPLVAINSYQLPLLSFFANIIAVPLMSVSAIPLCLLGVICTVFSLPLATRVYQLAEFCLAWLWQWLTWLADHPWAMVDISFAQIITALFFSLLCSFLVLASAYLKRFFKYVSVYSYKIKGLAGALLFLFFWLTIAVIDGDSLVAKTTSEPTSNANQQKQQQWRVDVLDVGQGLAVVIVKNNQALLYDTGASYPSGFNMAEAVIIPYMHHYGFDQFQQVLISHNDNDHAGSLPVLLANNKVSSVIANPPLLGNDSCQQGKTLFWQGLTLAMLSPKLAESDQANKNNLSCVVRVSDGQHSILLTGDVAKKIEQQLVNTNMPLATDILIAPHHGSNTSSSSAFIEAVAPSYVVFSAGYLNRWRMPVATVLQRYQHYGDSVRAQKKVTLVSTAQQGMIRFAIDAQGIVVNSYRQHYFPFWFANSRQASLPF